MSARRWRPRPLTVAQILSSAAGALPMVIGAVRMEAHEFAGFSTVILVVTLAVGASRAGLLQPALLQQRADPDSRVTAWAMLAAATLAGAATSTTAVLIAGVGILEAAIIGAAGALPVVHDWSRYRAIGVGSRWAVVVGDGLRLTVVAATALPWFSPRTTEFVVLVGAASAVATAAVIVRARIGRSRYPVLRYRRAAGWQLLDFVVGQFVVSVPIIVLAGTGANLAVGGVRLAQTLLGPLNLAFAATSTNIVADGATDESFRDAAAVISRGRRASMRLLALAGSVVSALLLVVLLTGVSTRGVAHGDLLLGMVLVGGSTIMTGWAGIHGIVLRVLGHQSAVTLARIGIAVVTVGGFVLGYTLGDVRLSLIMGFGGNAAAAPALFLPVAMVLYRRHRRS